MSRLHEQFAFAVRQGRQACGWSQAELAEKVCLSLEAYGRLERGRVLPRAGTLVRIATVLNVSTDDLLGRGAETISAGSTERETQLRILLARLHDARPEDLSFLATLISEMQRWRSTMVQDLVLPRRSP